MPKKLIVWAAATVLLTVILSAPPASAQSHPPTEAEITAYLQEHPLLNDTNAAVISVYYQGEALVINLSEALLPEGDFDEAIFTRLQADLDQVFSINQRFMTTFKVEGKTLDHWGQPIPTFDVTVEPPSGRESPFDGPLTGVKIALSPGHGLYWHEDYSMWRYQRVEFWGIREDTLNSEIMRYVQTALLNQGATVIQLRELDLSPRIGVTGFPAWHEASRQYAIAQGLPEWIYNGSNTNYNSDIRARPYMANYYGADLLISLHNNGWNGSLSGTETYYDTDNHPRSQALANAVHNRIINTIRAERNASWINRGVKPSYSDYGEINYARMPAALIELAFMDREIPDNAYLHDESFKRLSARAITQGICDFWGVHCPDVSITLPVVMETPRLTPAYQPDLCVAGWLRYPNVRGRNAYLALNTSIESESTHQAQWTPLLPVSGTYQLEAFIPAHGAIDWQCPQKTIREDTAQAVYQVRHVNGNTSKPIDQGAFSDQWADLGTYHFNDETPAAVILSDLTWETAQTRTVSASAFRFTLVGNANTPFYNTAWLEANRLTDQVNAPTDFIRNFMELHHSCLVDPLPDTDGQVIDIPQLLHQAAIAQQVSPKILLAIMEAEQNALSVCPDANALANLMGQKPSSTARAQIIAAATKLRQAMDALADDNRTPNGWATGIPKRTLDGVRVTPANDAITILLDYTQMAGDLWGGNLTDTRGAQGIYSAWERFYLNHRLPRMITVTFIPLHIR